jgi:hypothetical protein
MNELVFLLEERSAQEMLTGLLPRILPPGIALRYIVFEGKQDLEKQLVRRLRGYRVPTAKFIVLRDQDASDCKKIKSGLVAKCKEAGRPATLVRIACHELESWYLADLQAVERGLGLHNLARKQAIKPFCSPDDSSNPSNTLSKLVPAYQKVSGSRAIGPYLDPQNNRSTSFSMFIKGVRELASSS